MEYSVEEQTMEGDNTLWHNLSKREAVLRARKAARRPDANIYISWYRKSDGQHGYLNFSGDHAITGKPW
jgi:hypothetical protein